MRHALLLLTTSMPVACADTDRDLPRLYRRAAVPEARLSSSEGRAHGRALFLEHCALCHGVRGDGQGERTEGLTRRPRDFTSAEWRRSTSPRHVFFAIREGLAGTPMPQWKSLSEEDAWDLTAYVLSVGGSR
jgi:mono/diheme cytochrome c family protein